MNQLEKSATELKQNNFIDVDCVELMIRNIEAREGMSRPSMRMIGHTTYLIFARKTSNMRVTDRDTDQKNHAEILS
jgi:tRNA (adenine57-N1/adenine58-N1)-methyltransferase